MCKFVTYRVLLVGLALCFLLGYEAQAQNVRVVQDNDLFGLKIEDRIVLRPQYQKVEALGDGKNYYSFSLNGKVGLVSLKKQSVISDPVYDEVEGSESRPSCVYVTKSKKNRGVSG